MCGIIAGKLLDKKFNKFYCNYITKMFLQSQIRGKHATGISIFSDNKIQSIILPIPAEQFIQEETYKKMLTNLGNKEFIGHVRYSTSDISYNQPIKIKNNFCIAHNGVMTQREFVHWHNDFAELLQGYKLKTKNDTELLGLSYYRFLRKQKYFNPFVYFPKSSIGCCVLYNDKIYFFRNGKRPLYYYLSKKYFFVASTKDIFLRSGLKEKYIKKVKPFKFYKFVNGNIKIINRNNEGRDLQK